MLLLRTHSVVADILVWPFYTLVLNPLCPLDSGHLTASSVSCSACWTDPLLLPPARVRNQDMLFSAHFNGLKRKCFFF